MADIFVRNGVVRDNYWKQDGFFETHEDGFVAAAEEYETPQGIMTVLFKDEGACFLIDDETGMPATRQDLLSTLRDLYKAGELDIPMEEAAPDSYCEIAVSNIIVDREMLESFGFSDEQIEDVQDRLTDLSHYFVVEEVEG